MALLCARIERQSVATQPLVTTIECFHGQLRGLQQRLPDGIDGKAWPRRQPNRQERAGTSEAAMKQLMVRYSTRHAVLVTASRWRRFEIGLAERRSATTCRIAPRESAHHGGPVLQVDRSANRSRAPL